MNSHLEPIKRSAYVHVPFCRHRCGYCNFTLVAGRDDLIQDYLRALTLELSWLDTPRPVETIFIGGGTPSHLSVDELDQLLRMVRKWFVLPDGSEFSLESNPKDLSSEKIAVMNEQGVNRLSLGVQSFNNTKLKILERDHNAETIHASIETSRSKIDNLSIDLIFGVPGETYETWQADLRSAVELPITHLSTYGLTFELGTRFWSRKNRSELVPVEEELERTMYESAIETLELAGFEHYEVSNFAQAGFRCRHNEVYWTGGEYYGVGPGAASHLDGIRRTNHRSTTTYLNRVLRGESPISESDEASPKERARERLVFGLRRMQGIHETEFLAETGFSIDELAGEQIELFCRRELLLRADSTLKLSRKGLLVSDTIWPYLI